MTARFESIDHNKWSDEIDRWQYTIVMQWREVWPKNVTMSSFTRFFLIFLSFSSPVSRSLHEHAKENCLFRLNSIHQCRWLVCRIQREREQRISQVLFHPVKRCSSFVFTMHFAEQFCYLEQRRGLLKSLAVSASFERIYGQFYTASEYFGAFQEIFNFQRQISGD